MRMARVIGVVLLVAAAAWAFSSRKSKQPVAVRPLSEKAAKSLAEHSTISKKDLVSVTGGWGTSQIMCSLDRQ
jgi:hypothetical protein